MQGNLNEIDIRSILQLIELGQRTGELFVEAYGFYNNYGLGERYSKSFKQQFWFVFFLNGQIIYAADGDVSLSRLKDYLRRYRIDETRLEEITISSLASTNAPEYGYLWALLEQHIITPNQARTIIHSLVNEILFDLLSLHQGSFIFELGPALAPQLTTLEIAPLVTKIMKQVQEWKQLHLHIQSPEQCPVIADKAHLRSSLPTATVNKLEQWADGKTSLRQLSRYLNRDIVTVARAIYPYVQQGWVQMVAPIAYTTSHKWGWGMWTQTAPVRRIVCIDDGITTCKTVETILKQQGYEAIGLTNPVQALSLVFQLKPDLILCDIAMPQLDGYEVCAMLRHSTAFRLIPIVMLTGKDGFIDRVKAKMVGATDYLTKPFGDSELLMLVEKYLATPGHPTPSRDSLLVDSRPDEIQINITESTDTSTAR